MTSRQEKLFRHHYDSAQLLTTKDNPVFWVLDLDDPGAFEMACEVDRRKGETDPETKLAALREDHRQRREICCQTLSTNLNMLNLYLQPQHQPLLPARYYVLISEGRRLVSRLP